MVVGGGFTGFGIILTSDDGYSWTEYNFGAYGLNGVTWTGSQFVSVGYSGSIITSSDGTSWSTQSSGTSQGINDIIWTGSELLAVGHGVILSSEDGIVWNARIAADITSPLFDESSATHVNLHAITWTGSHLVAVGSDGKILTSVDGYTWEIQTVGDLALYNLTWTGEQLIAVGESGTILTSPEGFSWTERTSGTSKHLKGICWTGKHLIATGRSGTALTSLDGISWSPQNIDSIFYLNNVIWAGNQVIAAGGSGYLFKSSSNEFNNPYSDWTQAHSLFSAFASESADPDGDGLNNLLEFSINSNPTLHEVERIPNLSFAIESIEGSNIKTAFFSYFCNPNATNITYSIMGTDDLAIGFHQEFDSWNSDGTIEHRSIEVPSDYERLFLRLEVTRN